MQMRGAVEKGKPEKQREGIFGGIKNTQGF